MSKRRDITLSIALCVSLIAHVLLVRAMVDADARARIGFPGFPTFARAGDAADDAKPLIVSVPPIVPTEGALGQRNGTGNATDALPGEEEMQSRLVSDAQVQPLTRREPPGVENSAPMSAAPQAAPTPPQPESESQLDDEAPVAPFGAVAHLGDEPTPSLNRPLLRSSPAQQSPAQQSAAQSASEAPAPSGPLAMTTGVPAPRGTSAPQGESEMDPFALIGSAEFRNGRTNVQLGRPHRLTQPRFDLRSLVDTIPLGGVRMALSLRIDQTGNVVSADVAESSGSKSIDQLFKVSAYDWWFEPKTDAGGTPRSSETFRFGIVMR